MLSKEYTNSEILKEFKHKNVNNESKIEYCYLYYPNNFMVVIDVKDCIPVLVHSESNEEYQISYGAFDDDLNIVVAKTDLPYWVHKNKDILEFSGMDLD